MDSFTLSVMYQTAESEGGNSAISQGVEAETLRGRNITMQENSVIVYPNPARYEIKIRHSYSDVKSLIVELYDYTGRKVKVILCKDCNQETTMQVSEFASGLYTYKVIVDNNLILTGKLNII